ncbi:SGNH/GDSL hydrolase family protein, partial [Streptomyces sp. DT225]
MKSSRNKAFCRTVGGVATAVALASLAVGTTASGAWAASAEDPVQYVALG